MWWRKLFLEEIDPPRLFWAIFIAAAVGATFYMALWFPVIP